MKCAFPITKSNAVPVSGKPHNEGILSEEEQN